MSTFIDIYYLLSGLQKNALLSSLSGYNMNFLDLSAFTLGLVWDYQVKVSYLHFSLIWPYDFLLQEEQGREDQR